jgi:hypothetical protein
MSICVELDESTSRNLVLRRKILELAKVLFRDLSELEAIRDSTIAVFSPTNWQKFTRIRINSLSNIKFYTYGDGVSLYIPFHHFDSLLTRAKLFYKYWYELRRPTRIFYLASLSLGLISLNKSDHISISTESIIRTLKSVHQYYQKNGLLGEIKEKKNVSDTVTVLLTANFSEAGYITQKEEIDSYLKQISNFGFNGDIILHHHPRDSDKKKIALKSEIESKYPNIFFLEDSSLSAFEWRLLELNLEYKKVNVISYTSSIIGAYLFTDSVLLGSLKIKIRKNLSFIIHRKLFEFKIRKIITHLKK